MVWGIIMFICGILAIALPLLLRRHCNRAGLADSLRRCLPFNLRLPIPQHRRVPMESAVGDRLRICWRLHVDAPAIGRDLSHVSSSDLFSDRRSGGDYFLLQDSRSRERGLGFVRWHCHADSRIFNLAPMAVELGVGHRNLGRHQLDL